MQNELISFHRIIIPNIIVFSKNFLCAFFLEMLYLLVDYPTARDVNQIELKAMVAQH